MNSPQMLLGCYFTRSVELEGAGLLTPGLAGRKDAGSTDHTEAEDRRERP